jgi:alpha-tubulin suppressor-like RCC1 family protein
MPNFSGVWNLKEQIQAIAAGRWTGLPLPELYAWGQNSNGELGQSSVVPRSSPVQIGALYWSDVSTLDRTVLAVRQDATLWAWGRNSNGQVGDNTVINRSSPVQIGTLTTWQSVRAGGYHSLAKKTDGTLWSWGNNFRGQLGTNNITYRSSPVQIGALTTWANLAAGSRHSLATKNDGTLWAWGYNFLGQLGINLSSSYSQRSSPVQVGALTNWSRPSASGQNSASVKTDGTLWTWGSNNAGQLGTNDTAYRSSPVQVGGLADWAQVSAGTDFTTAIKTTGTIWSWGSNSGGKLGTGSAISGRSSPAQIGALTNWMSVSGTQGHVIASKVDGTVWGWGQGYAGAIGNNSSSNQDSPVQIGSLTKWGSVISTGNQSSFAIFTELTN